MTNGKRRHGPSAVDALSEDYIQNTGWTPDARSYFGNTWAIGRAAMPHGLAVQTHVVAENDRVASITLWDGTVTASGQSVDFASADLRIERRRGQALGDSRLQDMSRQDCHSALMTILEGIDPDGLRVIVAYLTPRRLPRTAIAERLRG
jgi:hypothetical protein